MIRAGRYTRRPFQADQLHVDIWWQGMNLARDAGTYLYNGPLPWNNGLAGTAVHNTVTVDHRDQMRRAGRFLWVDWAQASGRSYCSRNSARADRFEGEHDGYRRSGIRYRRMVQWLPDAGWVIADDMEGTGAHDLRLHWLTADLPYEISKSPFQVTFKSGQSRVCWNIFSSSAGRGAIVRAGAAAGGNSPVVNTALLGWESPTYGDLRPAVSMVYDTQSRLPVRFVTVVLTGERCRVQLIEDHLVVLKNESEIYRVSVSTKTMLGAKPRPSRASNPES
jgi:hypothetical protein